MSEKLKKIIKAVTPEKYFRRVREKAILKQHRKVADFWNPIIDLYFENKIEKYNFQPKKIFDNAKIIWQYWGQGVEDKNLPEIIRICFASVDKYKEGYQVIRLTDDTIKDYIDLPEFVREKRENSTFTRTFFSDLLRLALLNVYGGVWLDATILLTGHLLAEYEEPDYFAFQRSDDEKHKYYWEGVYAYYFGWHQDFKVRFLSSVMFAKSESEVIAVLLDLMLYYWKTENNLSDYFCFQILYNELVHGKLSDMKCPIVNDCIPHIIQTKINGKYESVSFEEAIKHNSIHKMAYFNEAAMVRLRKLLTEHDIL